jgi:hypothetical protein
MAQAKKTAKSKSLTPRLSSTGLNIWGGRIIEDYLPELRGKQAINVYNEMRKGNPIAGGFVRAIEMAFRSVIWSDLPYEESEEAVKRAALLTSARNDMRDPWAVFVANTTTVLPFGHAPFEMTFKRRQGKPRSEFSDNKVGLDNLDLIPQDTIERWETEEGKTDIIGITQSPPPLYIEVLIPMEKVVNFRLRTEKDNPEGESIFRQAYRPWYFMNNLEAIEGISLERTGAGIPVIILPKGATTIKDKGPLSDEQAAIEIVKQVRVDEQGGVVLFDGWEFRLARPEGRVDPDLFDLAIKRHRSNMLISVLAAFLEFGTARVGSFALAQQSRSFFEVALEGYVSIIEETFNRKVVPLLFELNGITDGKYPKLIHTTVGDPQLQELSRYITDLTKSGFLKPDPVLNNYLKEVAKLPTAGTVEERLQGKEEEEEEVQPQIPGGNGATPFVGEEDDEQRREKRRVLAKADEEGEK